MASRGAAVERRLLHTTEAREKHEIEVSVRFARTIGRAARRVRGVRSMLRMGLTCWWLVNLHWLRMIAIIA